MSGINREILGHVPIKDGVRPKRVQSGRGSKAGQVLRAGLAGAVILAGTAAAVKEVTNHGSVTGPVAERLKDAGKATEEFLKRVRQEGTTEEQTAAAYALVSSKIPYEQRMHNLIVVGKFDGKRILAVALRNRPTTEEYDRTGKVPSKRQGKVIGYLEAGTRIPESLVVVGADPKFPYDKNRKGLWFAFRDPNNSLQVVFADLSGFQPQAEFLEVEPIDLSKPPSLNISPKNLD